MKEKFLGCMYGLAIGDALGFPVEFLTLKQIKEKYGEKGIEKFESFARFLPGTFSDDTQMSLATAQALIRGRKDDSLEKIMGKVKEEYVVWSHSRENNRAPGETCMRGCANLAQGIHWTQSGIKASKGCGAAMRTAPIGLYFNNLDKLIDVAYGASICTHAHDTGISSGIATALLTRLALNGCQLNEISAKAQELLNYAGKRHNFNPEETNQKLQQVVQLLQERPESAIPKIGEGWVGEEAIGIATYCFLKYPKDYKKAVLTAVNITGDSDSTGCITGAISGTYNGIQGIPKKWLEKVEKKYFIRDLSEMLREGA